MSLRLLHTADWQLGKRFRSIPGDVGALVRAQRMETLRALCALADERNVDVGLVAGDVFEFNEVEDATLKRVLRALGQSSAYWLLLPGNHDPALAVSAWTRMQNIGCPDNVSLLTTPEPFLLERWSVAVLPAPLTQRHVSSDLTAYFDRAETPKDWFRIGLAHGSVRNRLPQASESPNPISDTRAQSARLDYLALGDWHGTLEIAPRTWYAGTPEPDRFLNNASGQALIVELSEPGANPSVEPVEVGHYRWTIVDAEISDDVDIEALRAELEGIPDAERTLVRTRVQGAVNLRTRDALHAMLEATATRFRHLDVRDQKLSSNATDEELQSLREHPVLRDVVGRLTEIEADAAHPEQAVAQDALQLLYREHVRMRTS